MSEQPYDYYLTYDLPEDLETDDGVVVVRVRRGDGLLEGSSFTRDGVWVRSTVLRDIQMGFSDLDFVPVPRERAVEVITKRVEQGRFPRLPEEI